MKFYKYIFLGLLVIFGSYYFLSDKLYYDISSELEGAQSPSRWYPLIDNGEALEARRDLWLNPKADFIYMSTYEFFEDTVGLSQVYWAVKRAREGKTVHLVLDDVGHRLGNEILLYMVKNNVNVHVWSPKFSIRGKKHRFELQRKQHGRSALNPKALSAALFRQATFRMHDKILFSNATNSEVQKVLGTSEKVGQAIIGGRNAAASHYGLDPELVQHKEKLTQIYRGQPNRRRITSHTNPKFEYEHEVLIHSPKVQYQIKNYITDLLQSKFTERVSVKDLEAKLEKSKGLRKIYENFWLSKALEVALQKEEGFRKFSQDIYNWNVKYQSYAYGNSETKPKQLFEDFYRVFTKNGNTLVNLIDRGKMSPRFLSDNFSTILSSPSVIFLEESARRVQRGEITSEEFFRDMLNIIKWQQKVIEYRIAHSLDFESNVRGFMGPLNEKGGFVNTLAKLSAKLFDLDFDVDKFESLEERLEENNRYLEEKVFVQQKADLNRWFRLSFPTKNIHFIHDTVDNDLMEKRVMNQIWDRVASSRGNIIFNSQYGTPSPRGINALDNYLKFNSAAFRLSYLELNKGGVGAEIEASINFVKKLVALIKDNKEDLTRALKERNYISPKKNPLRESQNRKDLERFTRSMASLASGKVSKNIRNIGTRFLNKDKTVESYINDFMTILNTPEAEESFKKSLMRNKDVFSDNLVNLRGFVDSDPNKILGEYKQKRLEFITNDRGTWRVGADPYIHDDFHIAMESIWRRFGKGLYVRGLSPGEGRIHSKVAVSDRWGYFGSANMDYRSEYLNLEVGVLIEPESQEGRQGLKYFQDHIKSYLNRGTLYIENGHFVGNTNCRGAIRRWVVKHVLRKQL